MNDKFNTKRNAEIKNITAKMAKLRQRLWELDDGRETTFLVMECRADGSYPDINSDDAELVAEISMRRRLAFNDAMDLEACHDWLRRAIAETTGGFWNHLYVVTQNYDILPPKKNGEKPF